LKDETREKKSIRHIDLEQKIIIKKIRIKNKLEDNQKVFIRELNWKEK
jgi:hypothetical protein